MSGVCGLKVLLAGGLRRGTCPFAAAWLTLLCALPPSQALARQQHAYDQHAVAKRETNQRPVFIGKPGIIEIGMARLTIPDVEVRDQDGKRVRFYSHLIKDRVVVVNFFFTSCTYVCPVQGRTLAKLRAGLAERLGKEVFIVSVSRDPETDTPERLKRWGADYGVSPGWTLVTGEKGIMARLVRDFTGEGLGRETHLPFFLVGNDRTGIWTEVDGPTPPEELVKVIDRVAKAATAVEK